ncbi:MAG: BON domain-containing protein [Bacteroidota bacterium]
MQAKPLALTIIVVGVLAFLADALLVANTPAGARFEQSQVAPVPSRHLIKPDSVAFSPPIVVADSLERSLTVAQQLQDLTLIAQISKKLFRTRTLEHLQFDVQATEGHVILAGLVPSILEQRRAVRIAQSVKGVKSVTSELKLLAQSPSTSESSSE